MEDKQQDLAEIRKELRPREEGTSVDCRDIPKMVMAQKPPTEAELRKRFFYHPPRDQQAVRNHEAVSLLTFELAKELCAICPPGRHLLLALTELERVRMHANAAIAVDDPRD